MLSSVNNHIQSHLMKIWGDFEPGILLYRVFTSPLLFFAFRSFLTFGTLVSLWRSPATWFRPCRLWMRYSRMRNSGRSALRWRGQSFELQQSERFRDLADWPRPLHARGGGGWGRRFTCSGSESGRGLTWYSSRERKKQSWDGDLVCRQHAHGKEWGIMSFNVI